MTKYNKHFRQKTKTKAKIADKINSVAKKRELAWEKIADKTMIEYVFEIYLRSFLLNVPLIQQ